MSIKWNNNNNNNNINKFGFKLERINTKENRFHGIYLIDNLSGAVLVSNRYSGMSDTQDDLISGFLSAMNSFIKEIRNDDTEEIQEVNFKDSRILYERRGRLMCIGISKKTNLQIERGILHEIMNDFYDKFRVQIKGFNGVIDPAILDYRKTLQSLNLNSLFKFEMSF